MNDFNLPKAWQECITPQLLHTVDTALQKEQQPWHPKDVFRALALTSPDSLKVVLLGMDPYPTEGIVTFVEFPARGENFTDLAKLSSATSLHHLVRAMVENRVLAQELLLVDAQLQEVEIDG